jgi:hypothetical protein
MIFKDFSDFATDVLTRYRSLLAVSGIPVSTIKIADDHAKLIGTSAIVIAIIYWLTMLLAANRQDTLAVVLSALILLGLIYVVFFIGLMILTSLKGNEAGGTLWYRWMTHVVDALLHAILITFLIKFIGYAFPVLQYDKLAETIGFLFVSNNLAAQSLGYYLLSLAACILAYLIILLRSIKNNNVIAMTKSEIAVTVIVVVILSLVNFQFTSSGWAVDRVKQQVLGAADHSGIETCARYPA